MDGSHVGRYEPRVIYHWRRTDLSGPGGDAAAEQRCDDAVDVMPDVGLTTSTEPLDPKYRVVIKYSVEVEGLPVYNESYDAEKIAKELAEDEEEVAKLWLRRLKCVTECRHRRAFSASLTSCLADGKLVE
jgi:hypothetical protein